MPNRTQCNEICPKPLTGSCKVCDALDDADQFVRRWFYGGCLWEALIWFLRPFNDSFRIIELVAILVAITAFFMDIGNRQEEREARAWQLLTTKAPGNSGKIWALQYLNREKHWPLFPNWWPLNKKLIPLVGIDLTPPDLVDQENGCSQGQGVYLRGVELPNAKLSFAFFTCADLQRAILPKADLRGARLQEADFQGARLQEADFRGAILPKADLRGARLQEADFRGATLLKADLQGARLQEADFRGATLLKADLQGARLQKADFRGATLLKADLQGARLQEADFRGARLQKADLQGADLRGADLRGTTGIGCAQLRQAEHWWLTYRGPRVCPVPAV